MTARTSPASVPRRTHALALALSASLSSCAQWLEVPGDPELVEGAPPRAGPAAPPQWRPPLEARRYFRERNPPGAELGGTLEPPSSVEPPVSTLPPDAAPSGAGTGQPGGGGVGSAGEGGGGVGGAGEGGAGENGSGEGAGAGNEASDAGPSAPSSETPARDAAIVEPEPPPACAGVDQFGICWYLGAPGASCQETCAGRGGYDDAATARIGTERQGGSREDCVVLLNALGARYQVQTAAREDEGVGCHLLGSNQNPYWLSRPAFDVTACLSNVRIVCGCRD